ncbi:MAG: hypothetical protein GF331_00925 [Chitinivibrionales bacterium]|nr:hypothetical protein [Chitinivibrionales bacterium]
MKRILSIPSVVLLVLLIAAPSWALSGEERLARFLAGCKVLNTAVTASPEHKAAAMQWLVEHTGLTPAKAAAMIGSYRNRPDDWTRVVERMQTLLGKDEQKGDQ